MSPTDTKNTNAEKPAGERAAFKEPTISEPMDLSKGAERGPLMALTAPPISGGGPTSFDGDGTFFPPRGDGDPGFGDVGSDGGFGPGSDPGAGID